MDKKASPQKESEWEKDLSFRFDTWLKLYPGTPTIGEIEEWFLESLRISITTAVSNRENEIAEEVKKLYSLDYMKGSPASYINRALDKVLQILKH